MIAINEHLGKYPDPEEAKKHREELRIGLRHFEAAFQKVKPLSLQQAMLNRPVAEKVKAQTGISIA
jgi:hypothetical protein